MIQLPAFAPGKCRHAFYTRRGGVSTGIYRSLNCGFGSADSQDAVAANRARAMAALECAAGALFTCNQVHSADVHVIDMEGSGARGSGEGPATPPRADAMVTAQRNVALGVLSADCTPLLFAAPEDGIIGACHAGWRGAVGGVIEATVEAMIELGARADNIQAAIGPCIGQDSYEVGPEFPRPFLEQDRRNAAFFASGMREGHFRFDLAGYCLDRLERLGLGETFCLDRDTCREESDFFSYRRSCHRQEPDYGRQLSTIVMPE